MYIFSSVSLQFDIQTNLCGFGFAPVSCEKGQTSPFLQPSPSWSILHTGFWATATAAGAGLGSWASLAARACEAAGRVDVDEGVGLLVAGLGETSGTGVGLDAGVSAASLAGVILLTTAGELGTGEGGMPEGCREGVSACVGVEYEVFTEEICALKRGGVTRGTIGEKELDRAAAANPPVTAGDRIDLFCASTTDVRVWVLALGRRCK